MNEVESGGSRDKKKSLALVISICAIIVVAFVVTLVLVLGDNGSEGEKAADGDVLSQEELVKTYEEVDTAAE